MKIWDQYKHIKCGDFIAWWSKLSTKQKLEWKNKKDEVDFDLEKMKGDFGDEWINFSKKYLEENWNIINN